MEYSKLKIDNKLNEFLTDKIEDKDFLFYDFDFNNQRITVIKNKDSYGSENDLFEIGVHNEYNIDTYGHLTNKEVIDFLSKYLPVTNTIGEILISKGYKIAI